VSASRARTADHQGEAACCIDPLWFAAMVAVVVVVIVIELAVTLSTLPMVHAPHLDASTELVMNLQAIDTYPSSTCTADIEWSTTCTSIFVDVHHSAAWERHVLGDESPFSVILPATTTSGAELKAAVKERFSYRGHLVAFVAGIWNHQYVVEDDSRSWMDLIHPDEPNVLHVVIIPVYS